MSWTRSWRASPLGSLIGDRRLRAIFGFLIFALISTPFLEKQLASALLAGSAVLGLATGAVLTFTRSKALPQNERNAWRWFGGGIGVAAIGIAVHGIAWMIASDVPVYGPIDMFWLSGYFLGIVGLARLPHATGSSWQRVRLLLDGLIGAVAVGAILWATTLRDLTSSLGNEGRLEEVIGSAYIILDSLVLVVLMIVVVRRSTYRFDLRLVFIALAAVAQGIGDVAFLTSGIGRSFTEAEPIYPLNILAVGMFAATGAIIAHQPASREYAARVKTPAWAVMLPYSFAAIMVALLIFQVPGGSLSPDSAGLFYATLTIGALVIVRQAVAIRENRRLVEDQQTALVASISHELRTPLTAMVGFLELIDAGEVSDDDERTEMTSIVTHQANYLSRVVSDLVMLASENITKMDLDIEPTRVDALAWDAVHAAGVNAGWVEVDAPKGIVAYLDRDRIQQALANLLANAMRYGGDQIQVVADAEGGDLMLEVHDDGQGVPRRFELLIWEKFERGPNRLNATIPGSGIGLAVTKAIAEAHGGSAGYHRSNRLGGACFWLRLPGRVHAAPPQPDDASAHLTVIDNPDIRTA